MVPTSRGGLGLRPGPALWGRANPAYQVPSALSPRRHAQIHAHLHIAQSDRRIARRPAKSHDDADHSRVFRVGALGRGRTRRPSGPSSKRTPWSWGRCLSGAGKADQAPQIMHATCHSRLSLPPEILEPIRRQRCVDGGAGDLPMTEPACPGVAARAKPPIVMTPGRHQAIQEVFLGRPDGRQADRP
jgi:hypothetical protein